jgi:putative colanic acid biosynthesis acetyltransferase WcaB
MSPFKHITQDYKANKGNTKGKVLVTLFRLATLVKKTKLTKIIFSPYLAFYKFFVEWVMGVELNPDAKIGSGLRVYHGQALLVSSQASIGRGCTLRHCTTIGNAKEGGASPVIGDFVDIGCNVCIIGNIEIGNHVVIGAGTVVVKSIPSNCIVVGNPARIIKLVKSVPEFQTLEDGKKL